MVGFVVFELIWLFLISIIVFVLIQTYFLFKLHKFWRFKFVVLVSFIFIVSSLVCTFPAYLGEVPAVLLNSVSLEASVPYSTITCLESSKNSAAGVSWHPAHSSPDSFINLDPAIAPQLHFMTQSQAVLFSQCPNLHFPRQKNIQIVFQSSICFYVCLKVSFRSSAKTWWRGWWWLNFTIN